MKFLTELLLKSTFTVSALATAANVTLVNNQVYFQPYINNQPGTMLTLQNNSPGALGVTDNFVPGCSFAGCLLGVTPPPFPPRANGLGANPTCP